MGAVEVRKRVTQAPVVDTDRRGGCGLVVGPTHDGEGWIVGARVERFRKGVRQLRFEAVAEMMLDLSLQRVISRKIVRIDDAHAAEKLRVWRKEERILAGERND